MHAELETTAQTQHSYNSCMSIQATPRTYRGTHTHVNCFPCGHRLLHQLPRRQHPKTTCGVLLSQSNRYTAMPYQPYICCMSQTGQNEPCKGSCCPVWDMQQICWKQDCGLVESKPQVCTVASTSVWALQLVIQNTWTVLHTHLLLSDFQQIHVHVHVASPNLSTACTAHAVLMQLCTCM